MRIYVYENKKKKIFKEREINKEHLQKIKFLLNYPHKRSSKMTGYQKIKKDRDLLSKEYKILYNACMHYLATAKPNENKDFHQIANAIYEVGKLMNGKEE